MATDADRLFGRRWKLWLLGLLGFGVGIAPAAFIAPTLTWGTLSTAVQDRREAARADVCADAARHLLAADSVVALEREKYLLEAMRCDVLRQVRELRSTGAGP